MVYLDFLNLIKEAHMRVTRIKQNIIIVFWSARQILWCS